MSANLGAGGMRTPLGSLRRRGSPRDHAYAVLTKIGAPALPIFVEAFRASADQPTFASRLLSALRTFGPEGLAPYGSEFLKASREGSRDYRNFALELAALAADADPTLARSLEAELRSGLGSDEYDRRHAALDALQRGGSAGAAAIPMVVERLGAKSWSERREAARTLRAICPGRSECVAHLVEALDDEEERVRTVAIRALGGVGPAAAAAVPVLIARLETDPRARDEIMESLGEIGPAAGSALPQLAALARNGSLRDQAFAIETLPRIGRPDEARSVLLEAAFAMKASHQDRALRALAALGPHAEPALPELGRLLSETEFDSTRKRILDIYLGVGPAAAPHLRTLISEAGGEAACRSACRDLLVTLAKLDSRTADALE